MWLPIEQTGKPSSTVTQRLVFWTEAITVVGVHRPERAQVDDLGRNPLLGELLGGLQRVGHADAEADDRQVGPSRAIRALPIGTVKSSSSGTSKLRP